MSIALLITELQLDIRKPYKTFLKHFHILSLSKSTPFFFSPTPLALEMDGVGSTRLGRASARYGSTAVFNGPVRKWKKKWVHVSPSSPVKLSQSNGNITPATVASGILLCRWTPLSSPDFGSPAIDGEDEEQPPKRKFRYTPVALLEEELKKVAEKQVEDESKNENEIKQSLDWLSSKSDNELNMNKDFKRETQDSSMGNLDLGLCLKGHDGVRDSGGDKVGQEKAASSAGFWTMG